MAARRRSKRLLGLGLAIVGFALISLAGAAGQGSGGDGDGGGKDKAGEDDRDEQQQEPENIKEMDGPFAIREPNFEIVEPSEQASYHSVLGQPRLSTIESTRASFRRLASRYRDPLMHMRSPPFEPSARDKDGRVKPDEASGSSSSSTVGGQKILHDVVEDWGDEVWKSADQRAREAETQWRMVGRSESDADAIRAFQRATEAYRVLSDLKKKRIYQVSGSVGLENRMRGPRFQDPQRDAYKLELEFKTGSFMMDYGYREGQQKSTGNVHHNLKIPLLGFYTGFNMEVAIVRNEICSMCNGTGAAENAEMLACDKCEGSGKLSKNSHWRSKAAKKERREGGFDQTVTLGCQRCGSSGKLPSEPCPTCKGAKTVEGKATVKVYVEPGTLEGHSYTFKGEAEQAPDAVSGDVVLHVGAEEHEDFEREGNDLVCRRNITLAQALLGFKMEVKHLDGRMIEIERNEVTKPGQDHEVPGMGMPIHGKPGEFGKLIVRLNIVFPARIAVDEERGQRMREADRKAKKKRSRGWRGMFGGGDEEDEDEEGEDGEGPHDEGELGGEDQDEEEEYEEQQRSTRRGARARKLKEENFASEGEGGEPTAGSQGQGEHGDDEEEEDDDDDDDQGRDTSTRRGRGRGSRGAGGQRAGRDETVQEAPPPSPTQPSSGQESPLGAPPAKKGVGMYVEPVYSYVEPVYSDGGAGKVQIGLRVKGLLEGSPAALSGRVSVGDSLVQVDGVSVGGLKLKQLALLLLGPEGTVVKILLRSEGGEDKEVEIPRGDPIKKQEL